MSRVIATSAINGAYKIVQQAENMLAKAIKHLATASGLNAKRIKPHQGFFFRWDLMNSSCFFMVFITVWE